MSLNLFLHSCFSNATAALRFFFTRNAIQVIVFLFFSNSMDCMDMSVLLLLISSAAFSMTFRRNTPKDVYPDASSMHLRSSTEKQMSMLDALSEGDIKPQTKKKRKTKR